MENKIRNLKTPPIQEVILDVKFGFNEFVNIESLEEFSKQFGEEFPKKDKLTEFKIGFSSKKGAENTTSSQAANGFIMTSKTGKEVCQLKLNSFSFHKLAPYIGWDDFKSKCGLIWSKFSVAFPEVNINRIALRYVNKMEFNTGEGKHKLHEFIKLTPNVEIEDSNEIEMFNLSLLVPHSDKTIKAIINSSFEPISDELRNYVLDIDVFFLRNEKLNEISEFWNNFRGLRDFKNQLFFNLTTYKLTKQYD